MQCKPDAKQLEAELKRLREAHDLMYATLKSQRQVILIILRGMVSIHDAAPDDKAHLTDVWLPKARAVFGEFSADLSEVRSLKQ